jgi:hypothetical protein
MTEESDISDLFEKTNPAFSPTNKDLFNDPYFAPKQLAWKPNN